MRINEVILALMVAVAALTASSAKAQMNRGRDNGGGWHNGGGHGPQQPSVPNVGTKDQAVGTINAWVTGQNIDLTALLNLTAPYRRGEIVDSVVVYTNSAGYARQLTLIADGRVVASDNSANGISNLMPYQLVQISGWQQQIYLQVQGSAYITQIVMNLHQVNAPMPPPPPPPAPVPTPVPQPPPSQGNIVLSANLSTVGSSGTVELVSLLNLNAYRNYRLQSLIITGRAVMAGGQGWATLSINNVQAGQVAFTGMTQQQSIPLRGAWIAGLNTQQMLLQLQGVQASQVQLVLSR